MPANYARPAFDPAAAAKLQKPSQRKAAEKAAKDAVAKLTRAQVIAKVWIRDKERCVRCGKKCKRPTAVYPLDPDRGECNDIVPVSKGGNRLDVKNQELICRACHYGGPSGAHAPTAARMKTKPSRGRTNV